MLIPVGVIGIHFLTLQHSPESIARRISVSGNHAMFEKSCPFFAKRIVFTKTGTRLDLQDLKAFTRFHLSAPTYYKAFNIFIGSKLCQANMKLRKLC